MDNQELRKKYPFKPYQPAFYGGKIVQVMSWPTPEETIMVRLIPGDATTLEEIPAGQLRNLLRALLGDLGIHSVQADGLALLVERLGIDESSEVALLFTKACIDAHLDLSLAWTSIRHYLHDVLRRGSPENERESIMTDPIESICHHVTTFVKAYYDN